nr:MAG TPA: hypothetical protein [Caudoviricetes sp.]
MSQRILHRIQTKRRLHLFFQFGLHHSWHRYLLDSIQLEPKDLYHLL